MTSLSHTPQPHGQEYKEKDLQDPEKEEEKKMSDKFLTRYNHV